MMAVAGWTRRTWSSGAYRCPNARLPSLPLKIICDTIGIPDDQYEMVLANTKIILSGSDPESSARTCIRRSPDLPPGMRWLTWSPA